MPCREFGGITQRNYPNKAADFLVENKVKGNFFNDFNSGAYLIGRCFPDIKVFMDGRTEVYGPRFFQYYDKAWKQGDVKILEEILDKLPPETTKVIIAHRLNTIDNVDQIYFVNSGGVALAGSMEHAVDMLLHGKRES